MNHATNYDKHPARLRELELETVAQMEENSCGKKDL